MSIEFARSEASTLGLEWELALVDRSTGDLAPVAPEVIAETIGDDDALAERIHSELLTNTVEVVSGVHTRVADGVADLTATIDRIRAVTDRRDVDLMCAGTHPFARWTQQTVTDRERYATLIDRTQWWGRQLLIWGVHMHIGIDNRRKVLPILESLLRFYPHFQALSASSPYYGGEATGYASSRAMLFQQLPTAGLPPTLDAWDDYERVVDDLVKVGVIDAYDEIRWDIRPSPRWGTIELRICDGTPSVLELGALAALAQCLVTDLAEQLDDGLDLPTMQPWYVRENKWRAARYGMESIIIVDDTGEERLVKDDLELLLERLAPIADRLGCARELQDVRVVMDRGASYERQLRTAALAGGDLTAVVSELVAELRDGIAPA